MGAGRAAAALSGCLLSAWQGYARTGGIKSVHPLGKSPVVEDHGHILAESGAILEYLQETYDSARCLKPESVEDKLQYRFWLHYAEGSLMPLLLMKLVFASLGKPPVPFGMRTLGNALGKGYRRPGLTARWTPMPALLNRTFPASAGLPALS